MEKGTATHSSVLAWRIPWGCKELDATEQLSLYSCFAMLCSFPLYNKGNRLRVYAYPRFSGLLSHLGHHSSLSRVPVLHSRFSLVMCFICGVNGVYVSIVISQFVLFPFPPLVSMFVLCVCVFVSVLQISTASHPSLLVVGGGGGWGARYAPPTSVFVLDHSCG